MLGQTKIMKMKSTVDKKILMMVDITGGIRAAFGRHFGALLDAVSKQRLGFS